MRNRVILEDFYITFIDMLDMVKNLKPDLHQERKEKLIMQILILICNLNI